VDVAQLGSQPTNHQFPRGRAQSGCHGRFGGDGGRIRRRGRGPMVAASSRSESRVAGYATHHNGDCSFEPSCAVTSSTIPCCGDSLRSSTKPSFDDERYEAPEAPGLDTALRGLR